MTVLANGKPRQIAEGMTVRDFLKTLQLASEHVAVEYNNEPLARSLFATTRLAQDDQLEIAQMVGGG